MDKNVDNEWLIRRIEALERELAFSRETELALKEKERRLGLVLEATEDGVWNWDFRTGEVYFSPRYYTMVGYAENEFPPSYESWRQRLHPDDAATAEQVFRDAVENHTPFAIEFRFRAKDGKWCWILGRGKVVEIDEDGNAVRVAGSHTDITERKRSKIALENRIVALTQPLDAAGDVRFEDLFDLSELQRLQDLYAEAFGVAALITRPDGTPITRPSNFTRLCEEIIRKTPKGHKNCNYSDANVGRYNPSGPNIQICLSAGLCNAGASITVGGRHVANWLIGQVRNETQREEEIMVYAREIGADETDFRAAFREVPVMSWEQFERVARVLFELANQISTAAYQNVRQARVISERKRAEETLRKYERIVAASQDLMALINTDYIYEAVNDSFLKSRNRKRKEVVGSTVAQVMGEDGFQKMMKPGLDLAFSGQTVRLCDVFADFDGDRRALEVSFFPMRDEKGRVEGVVLNARDVTETRKLEEQLIQSQKIESLGTLAGGVAHEINNPINGIMNYAQLILDRTEQGNPAREFAREILDETQRIAAIVRNLLTFARHEKQAHSPAHFPDILKSVLSLIKTFMRRDRIDLHVEVQDDLPKLKCRSQQIQQVLMNLMTNARDALNERYPGYSPEKRLRVSAELVEKERRKFIRTTVEDTGPGISPEIRDRIFDPFFTTKPKESGTGLGLSISYGIVKDHGGELSVKSEPGRFTRFCMDLPVDNGWKLKAEEVNIDGKNSCSGR